MIGKLKSKNVRTVHDKKVMRIRIDVPYQEVKGGKVDGEGVSEWTENKVGDLIGFEFTALEDQDQETLMQVGDL